MDAHYPASTPTKTMTLEKTEAGMTKIRRNGPCPCGSTSKAKRCCYGNDRTTEIHRLHPPADLCGAAIPDLVALEEDKIDALLEEVLYLPAIDASLQAHLGIITPDMDRAIDAFDNDEIVEFVDAAIEVADSVDSPDRRLELAQAVLTLRDEGAIPTHLAAAAVLDLDSKKSNLLLSSVAHSLMVMAGATGLSQAPERQDY